MKPGAEYTKETSYVKEILSPRPVINGFVKQVIISEDRR
jgi:hypothetical protein